MRHHQHKGLYIALKLGGAAVATAAATAAAYKAYGVLNEKAKKRKNDKELADGRVAELNDEASHMRANDQEMLAEASLHHDDSSRLRAFMHHERGDEAPLYPGRFSTGGSF